MSNNSTKEPRLIHFSSSPEVMALDGLKATMQLVGYPNRLVMFVPKAHYAQSYRTKTEVGKKLFPLCIDFDLLITLAFVLEITFFHNVFEELNDHLKNSNVDIWSFLRRFQQWNSGYPTVIASIRIATVTNPSERSLGRYRINLDIDWRSWNVKLLMN